MASLLELDILLGSTQRVASVKNYDYLDYFHSRSLDLCWRCLWFYWKYRCASITNVTRKINQNLIYGGCYALYMLNQQLFLEQAIGSSFLTLLNHHYTIMAGSISIICPHLHWFRVQKCMF